MHMRSPGPALGAVQGLRGKQVTALAIDAEGKPRNFQKLSRELALEKSASASCSLKHPLPCKVFEVVLRIF